MCVCACMCARVRIHVCVCVFLYQINTLPGFFCDFPSEMRENSSLYWKLQLPISIGKFSRRVWEQGFYCRDNRSFGFGYVLRNQLQELRLWDSWLIGIIKVISWLSLMYVISSFSSYLFHTSLCFHRSERICSWPAEPSISLEQSRHRSKSDLYLWAAVAGTVYIYIIFYRKHLKPYTTLNLLFCLCWFYNVLVLGHVSCQIQSIHS